uniref:CCHC-type domain-containing protein n=1 Tax=Fagus sylvatica TaxID=28930 RepID=A0A2N9EZA8_FAGSY
MECEFSDIDKISTEEKEELKRSTKKIKENPRESAGGLSLSTVILKEDVDETGDDIQEVVDGVANVILSKDTQRRIRSKWAHSLIIKVFGRSVGFHFLHARIMSLWKPAGRLDCVDLGHGFFLIRFGLVEDFDKVLRGGPWFIGDHYLTIRPWEPNFKPSTANCSAVAVWARFPELPIEYYEESVLKSIGRALGPVLKIDTQTASESRGRYARICVQVNLDIPLTRAVRLGNLYQSVVYEGLNLLCFSCGRLGHRKENCPYTIQEPVLPPVDDVVILEPKEVKEVAGNISAEYGPWNLVQHRKSSRKTDSKKPTNPSKSHNFIPSVIGRDRAHGSRTPFCSPVADTHDRSESKLAHYSGTLPSPEASFSTRVLDSRSDNRPVLSKGKVKERRNGTNRSKPLGNISQRKNHGGPSSDAGPHKSHTNGNTRVVRPGAHDSLEVHISNNEGKPNSGFPPLLRSGVANLEKPLVGVLDRPTSSKNGELSSVEDASINFSGANLVRIESLRATNRKENAGGATNCNLLSGQQNSEETDPSVSPKFSFQSPGVPKGDEHGHHGSYCNLDERRQSHQAVSEGDGMEFDGANEESSSD